MSKETIIDTDPVFLENVEERHDGYVREWLKHPGFREALRNPVRDWREVESLQGVVSRHFGLA